MTWFVLRIIAMSTMLLDHIGWKFIDDPMYLTWIWRIAFPCYAFLLAEWFFFVFREKSRLLKHLSTLILLAVISAPCYDLMEFGLNNFGNIMESQSIIFTLLLWFLWMSLTEMLFPSTDSKDKFSWESIKEKFSLNKIIGENKVNWINIIILVCAYLLIGFTNYAMAANFNFVGPLLVIAFYWYLRYARNTEKTENNWNWVKRFLVLSWIFVVYLPIYFLFRSKFWWLDAWLNQFVNYFPWIIWHFLAALLLSFSNCKLWYHKRWFKILYTFFYPIHLLILGIILCF